MPTLIQQPQLPPFLAHLTSELKKSGIYIANLSLDSKRDPYSHVVTNTLHLELLFQNKSSLPVKSTYPFADWLLNSHDLHPVEPFALTPGEEWYVQRFELQYMGHHCPCRFNIDLVKYEHPQPHTSVISLTANPAMKPGEIAFVQDGRLLGKVNGIQREVTEDSYRQEVMAEWAGIERTVDPNKIDMSGKPFTKEDMEEAMRLIANRIPQRTPEGVPGKVVKWDSLSGIADEEVDCGPEHCVRDSTHTCTDCGDCMKKKPPCRTNTYWGVKGGK